MVTRPNTEPTGPTCFSAGRYHLTLKMLRNYSAQPRDREARPYARTEACFAGAASSRQATSPINTQADVLVIVYQRAQMMFETKV